MDYSAWAKENLTQLRLHHGRHVTSVWHTEDDKPLVVLVHGITGDRFGLVPLAVELAKDYRIAIVELPGHGQSGRMALPDPSVLQEWFADILKQIEGALGSAAFVSAHSFGCLAVLDPQVLRTHKVILLCPVPTPSPFYVHYSRTVVHSRDILAHIYNRRVFILLRSLVLTKVHTPEARRRVRWVGWNSKPSLRQISYQSKLAAVLITPSAFSGVERSSVFHVVCAIDDTTASERDSLDMNAVFPGTPATFLKGGHLLPIETPERVAFVIKMAMVD